MTIARVRTVFSGVEGTPYYSNLYFANDGGGDVSADAHDAVVDFWDSLKGSMAILLTWVVEADVTQIDEVTGEITGITSVAPVTGAGVANGDIMPTMTQLLGRLLTDTYQDSRRLRGRIFIPGMLESLNVVGRPAAALVSLATSSVGALFAPGGSAQPLVVWRRPRPASTDPVRPARAGSYALVTAAEVWTEWSVLRSRRD